MKSAFSVSKEVRGESRSRYCLAATSQNGAQKVSPDVVFYRDKRAGKETVLWCKDESRKSEKENLNRQGDMDA